MKTNLFPVLSLLFANLVVLVLAIIQESSIFDLIIIYWAENVIIGIYTIFKMMKCDTLPDPAKEDLMTRINQRDQKPLTKNQFRLIFVGHYFAFCLGHLIFIISVFYAKGTSTPIDYFLLLSGIGVLILSHGVSFFINYIGKKEYLTYNLKQLMGTPYGRILFVHVFIMSAAWLIKNYGSDSIYVLVAFVVGKVLADLWRHGVEHRVRPVHALQQSES